jgi:hypothetical protein
MQTRRSTQKPNNDTQIKAGESVDSQVSRQMTGTSKGTRYSDPIQKETNFLKVIT